MFTGYALRPKVGYPRFENLFFELLHSCTISCWCGIAGRVYLVT